MTRTFEEIRKEIEVLLDEYEADIIAYSDWYANWKVRQGDLRERVNPITGEIYERTP
jgi:hypothetical protein